MLTRTLVSHTDPNVFNTWSGDGVPPILWYVAQGINPQAPGVDGQDPDQDGTVQTRREYQYGTQPADLGRLRDMGERAEWFLKHSLNSK